MTSRHPAWDHHRIRAVVRHDEHRLPPSTVRGSRGRRRPALHAGHQERCRGPSGQRKTAFTAHPPDRTKSSSPAPASTRPPTAGPAASSAFTDNILEALGPAGAGHRPRTSSTTRSPESTSLWTRPERYSTTPPWSTTSPAPTLARPSRSPWPPTMASHSGVFGFEHFITAPGCTSAADPTIPNLSEPEAPPTTRYGIQEASVGVDQTRDRPCSS